MKDSEGIPGTTSIAFLAVRPYDSGIGADHARQEDTMT